MEEDSGRFGRVPELGNGVCGALWIPSLNNKVEVNLGSSTVGRVVALV